MMFSRRTVLTLALSALCLPLRAEEARPPQVGGVAPDFSLATADGKTVRLHEMTARGATVLVVLRGYPGYQCPLCTQQVNTLLTRQEEIRAAGGRVLFVYPGSRDRAGEFLKGKSLPAHFTLGLDPEFRMLQQYGLRWDAPNETSYPSTFVIDGKNRVQFALVSKSHGGRARVEDVLKALRSLQR